MTASRGCLLHLHFLKRTGLTEKESPGSPAHIPGFSLWSCHSCSRWDLFWIDVTAPGTLPPHSISAHRVEFIISLGRHQRAAWLELAPGARCKRKMRPLLTSLQAADGDVEAVGYPFPCLLTWPEHPCLWPKLWNRGWLFISLFRLLYTPLVEVTCFLPLLLWRLRNLAEWLQLPR